MNRLHVGLSISERMFNGLLKLRGIGFNSFHSSYDKISWDWLYFGVKKLGEGARIESNLNFCNKMTVIATSIPKA